MSLRSCLLLLLFAPLAHAADEPAGEGQFGMHHGYLFDVAGEKNRREIEMVMLPRPKENSTPLSQKIFNDRLSKEFQDQYQYKFGSSLAEQVLNTQAPDDGYAYFSGQNVTIQEYQKQQRQFGEYMMRRLTEFHVDDWAKKDPDFKPVYAVKEKMSNLSMAVKKGYKVRWKYNFAGPNMEFRLTNPYDIDTKVRMEMTGILSSPTEVIYSLGIPAGDKWYVSALHRQEDKLYQLVAYRPLTRRISGSVTVSTDQSDKGLSTKQDLYLVGLSWSD